MRDRVPGFWGDFDQSSGGGSTVSSVSAADYWIKPKRRFSISQFITTVLFALSVILTACCWFATSNGATLSQQTDNILLDFSAKWCGPCQQMSSLVSKLERENLPIRKVDVDVERELAAKYNVSSIPCFVLIANGREINRITGATDERTLRRMLMLLPKSPEDDVQNSRSSRPPAQLIPTWNSDESTAGSKKLLPKLPSMKGKSQDTKLAKANSPKTVRGQNREAEESSGASNREALNASTRIRVKNGSKVHFGSGTIINSDSDHAIILTCGHIFREMNKDGIVEVDYYPTGKSKPLTVIGQVLKFDPTSDLGLVQIPCEQPVAAISLMPLANNLRVKDPVVSVGCAGGDRPTLMEHSITAINRYDGPDTLECTGLPQQGRSGGGLFAGSQLIGVCIAADHEDKRGIYTGLKPVAQLLQKAKLNHLMPGGSIPDTDIAENEPSSSNGLGNAISMNDDPPPRRMDDDLASVIEEVTGGSSSGGSDGAVGNAADYVGAEIVCIVRPKTPGTISRVVIVNQATSRFVEDLLHESNGPRESQATAAKVRSTPAAKGDTRTASQTNRMTETSFESRRPQRSRQCGTK